jgi:hypothetical protein
MAMYGAQQQLDNLLLGLSLIPLFADPLQSPLVRSLLATTLAAAQRLELLWPAPRPADSSSGRDEPVACRRPTDGADHVEWFCPASCPEWIDCSHGCWQP